MILPMATGERMASSGNIWPPEPPDVCDRNTFHSNLLAHPWELNKEAAEWLFHAGIGYVRQ